MTYTCGDGFNSPIPLLPVMCVEQTGSIVIMVQQQEKADHLIVQNFFTERGLLADPIRETITKTPDFRILRGAETVAFCEVKSPQDIFTERLTAAIRQAGWADRRDNRAWSSIETVSVPREGSNKSSGSI